MKRFNTISFNFPTCSKLSLQEDGVKGISISSFGSIKMIDESLSIRQSILMILSIVPGERVMRPGYGCELYKLVFSPNDETTAGLAIHYIRKAIKQWEKRIDILSIDAVASPTNDEVLEITLSYRIKSSQLDDQIHYSFDLGGREVKE